MCLHPVKNKSHFANLASLMQLKPFFLILRRYLFCYNDMNKMSVFFETLQSQEKRNGETP